jgi:hypothetical protein
MIQVRISSMRISNDGHLRHVRLAPAGIGAKGFGRIIFKAAHFTNGDIPSRHQ